MLGQLSGEQQPDGGLNFPGGDRRPLVVVRQTGGFGGDAFVDVVGEAVVTGTGYGTRHRCPDGLVSAPCSVAFLLLFAFHDVLLSLAGERLLDGLSAYFRCGGAELFAVVVGQSPAPAGIRGKLSTKKQNRKIMQNLPFCSL
ncbi:hypothetical protein RP20_CCG020832 [Aedes albopictus]|nr:hypothetical protein RP20_CCG020832 [Aedes albopictus]